MRLPLIGPAVSRDSVRRAFTLVEILVAVVLAGLVMLGLFAISRASTSSAGGVLTRTNTASLKQRLDARIGQVVRSAPQLGDLQFTSPSVFSYRKREASGAFVCAYNGSAITVALTAAEVAELAVGDSLMVRVGQATADTTDDAWKVAPITSVATAAACGRTTTLSVTLPAVAPATSAIGTGASVRVWSTRRYASTLISVDSGYALLETVNGANATRMFAPYASPTVFEYLDAMGAAAGSATATRLIRATVQPYAWRDGERVTLLRETFEWPVRVDDDPTMAGSMLPVLGATVAVQRCTDPMALNFGDTKAACSYPVVCTAPLSQSQTYSCLTEYGAGWSGTFTEQRDKGPAPGCVWGAWVEVSNGCNYVPPTCSAPLSQYQSITCLSRYGTGYSGTISQQSDKSAYPGCAWGGWYDTGNNCVFTPPTCSGPASQYQTIACSSGYTGTGTQQQRDQGAYPACAYGAWYTTSIDCTLAPPPPPPPPPVLVRTTQCYYWDWYDISGYGDFKPGRMPVTVTVWSDGQTFQSWGSTPDQWSLNTAIPGTWVGPAADCHW